MTTDFEPTGPGEFSEYELARSVAVIDALRAAAAAAAAAVEAALRTEAARERAVDASLEDSFPASDPPCWTLGHTDG